MSGVSFHAPPDLRISAVILAGSSGSVVAQVQRHEPRVGLAAERPQAAQLRLEGHELDQAPGLVRRRPEAILHLGRLFAISATCPSSIALASRLYSDSRTPMSDT